MIFNNSLLSYATNIYSQSQQSYYKMSQLASKSLIALFVLSAVGVIGYLVLSSPYPEEFTSTELINANEAGKKALSASGREFSSKPNNSTASTQPSAESRQILQENSSPNSIQVHATALRIIVEVHNSAGRGIPRTSVNLACLAKDGAPDKSTIQLVTDNDGRAIYDDWAPETPFHVAISNIITGAVDGGIHFPSRDDREYKVNLVIKQNTGVKGQIVRKLSGSGVFGAIVIESLQSKSIEMQSLNPPQPPMESSRY